MTETSFVSPDEAHAELRNYWNTFAELYNKVPGRHTFKAILEHLGPLGPRALVGKHVLDLACGPGRGTVLLAEHAERVEAVDLSEHMLAAARAEHDLPNVTWHQAAAEALPLTEDSIDEAFCNLGLMLFPEPEPALAELRRVLRPGGRLHATVWGREEHTTLMTLPHDVAASLGFSLEQPERSTYHLGSPEALARAAEGSGLELTGSRYHSVCFPFDDAESYAMAFGLDLDAPGARLEQVPSELQETFVLEMKREAQRRLDRDGGVLMLDTLLASFQ